MAPSAAVERAVRFRLNQHSFLPGAEGVIGQVLELRREMAERLVARGCGAIVSDGSGDESGDESGG